MQVQNQTQQISEEFLLPLSEDEQNSIQGGAFLSHLRSVSLLGQHHRSSLEEPLLLAEESLGLTAKQTS